MSDSFIVHAGMMFDGDAMHGPSSVLVADGTIRQVRTDGRRIEAYAREVDLGPRGCLLPGLVDAHVHLCFDASSDPVTALTSGSDEELLATMRGAAAAMLQAGITTVRDLGDRDFLALRLREEIRPAPHRAPEILAAGPPLTTSGGHCYFLGGVAEGVPALRKAVRERAERGCDVVKVMASGGNMTPNSVPHESQYGVAELSAIVEEAHGLGLPVAAHTHSAQAVADALAAGVDSLEHVTFMTDNGVAHEPGIVADLASSGVFVDPTIGQLGAGAATPSVFASRLAAILTHFRDMAGAGVLLAFGSDCGIAPYKPHDLFPHVGAQAVEIMGITPLRALKGMTSTAAQACSVGNRKGRIAVGADADLLAVAGDPLADLSRLLDVQAVFRAGTRVR